MGQYDKEQKMLREMSRYLNKSEDELLREAIRTSYRAFKFAIPLCEKLKKRKGDKE